MSVLENRGGHPHVFTATIDTTGRKHRFPFTSKYVQIKAATNPCLVFFTEAHFDAGTNYITIPIAAAETPHGWEGPLEAKEIWLKGSGGNSVVELVAYQRRG